MAWFGNSQGERLAELERQLTTLTARVVKAEVTAAECAERAYRYMKKAEARARREVDEHGPEDVPPNQGRGSLDTPAPSTSRRGLWGARGRRMRPRVDPLTEVNGTDGVHS